MKGGEVVDLNNPYLTMDADKLVKHLEKFSPLYKYLNKYIYVYIGIIVVLFGILGYYVYQQFVFQGIPIAGIPPGITWDQSGMQFINYFYLTAKERYGLFSPSVPPTMNPDVVANFETDFDNFILTDNGKARTAIDTFCNIISPCNMCNCMGPDPNYAGPSASTPKVLYKGKDTITNKECSPTNPNPGKPDPSDGAKNVNLMQKKRGVSDLIFGRIPNCCCHLWKNALGDASNFTKTGLEKYINGMATSTDEDHGISSSTGCEPANPGNPAKLGGNDADGKPITVQPHVDGVINKYMFNMVTACIAKSKLTDLDNLTYGSTNNKVSNLSPEFMSCANYDVDLDEGISPGFVAKNMTKFVTPSLGNVPSSDNLGSVTDNYDAPSRSYKKTGPQWTDGVWTQTTGQAPKITAVKPSDWPTVDPFIVPKKGTKTINNYWYKSSSNIKYQLTVNNRLFEVMAFPVKKIDADVYDTELTDAGAKAYLDKYLSSSAFTSNPPFVYGGAFYVP
jgi:hypothetical protein